MAETKKQDAQHSQGGVTTRDDATDLGVPMLPGDPSEPVGPEDALGSGPKRGDYTNRLGGSSYQPHQSVAVPPEERAKLSPEEQASTPAVKVEAQAPRAEERGDKKGKKGGVDSA